MDVVTLKGYYIDPEQWHDNAQMICDGFFEFIKEEVSTCHGHLAKHQRPIEGVQKMQLTPKTYLMIRPHVFSQKYCIDDVDQKIQELVEWKKLAFDCIFDKFIEIVVIDPRKFTSIIIAIKILELDLPYQLSVNEQNLINATQQVVRCLKISKICKAQVYQVCLNYLREPSLGQLSPKFQEELAEKTACAVSRLDILLGQERAYMEKRRVAKELDAIEDEVNTIYIGDVKELYSFMTNKNHEAQGKEVSFRAGILRNTCIMKDIHTKQSELNSYQKLLYKYGLEKLASYIGQKMIPLCSIIKLVEGSFDFLMDSQILQTALFKSITMNLGYRSEIYSLETLLNLLKSTITRREELRIKCEEFNKPFCGLQCQASSLRFFHSRLENGMIIGPQSLILFEFPGLFEAVQEHASQNNMGLSNFRFQLIEDEDWPFYLLSLQLSTELQSSEYDVKNKPIELTLDELRAKFFCQISAKKSESNPPQLNLGSSDLSKSSNQKPSKKEKCIIS